MLTEDEIKRYQRHFNINGWDISTQLKLKEASVFVAGAGGLGSVVLYYLAAAGVGRIIFCDRDIVEPGNLNRQILYETDDIAKAKVDAAQEKLTAFNSNIDLIPVKGEISTDTALLLSGCSLIIDCLDNFRSRHILNSLSVDLNIPMIHAGVTEFYSQITFLKPGHTPCLACFIQDTKETAEKGIVGAMAGITGSIQALEAVKYLTGSGELLLNRILFIDMKNLSFNTMKISRKPDCAVCSKIHEA